MSTFASAVARLHQEFARAGVPFVGTARAPAMELQYAGAGEGPARGPSRWAGIEPLEGPIEARPVPRVAPGASPIRYFLDGAQRTFPIGRVGTLPLAGTVAAAAILTRDEEGRCAVSPGTLRLRHALIVPRSLDDGRLAPVLASAAAIDWLVVDPVVAASGKGEEGDPDAASEAMRGDYGRLVDLTYRAARGVRDELEQALLREWASLTARRQDEGWIVVDGRLRYPAARAVGLVKQFTDAILTGLDAETLLNLRPGERTTAFFPMDRFRGGDDPAARTLWYLRLHDADGLEGRHALVRVEVDQRVRATAEIDAVSSWLLAERAPRSTRDERWASLLYPVHLLERALKRRIDADTYGWPGA